MGLYTQQVYVNRHLSHFSVISVPSPYSLFSLSTKIRLLDYITSNPVLSVVKSPTSHVYSFSDTTSCATAEQSPAHSSHFTSIQIVPTRDSCRCSFAPGRSRFHKLHKLVVRLYLAAPFQELLLLQVLSAVL